MKRLVTVLAAFILLGACNDKNDDSTASTSGDNDLLKTNREMYRAIETGDSVAIRKHIASDAVDHNGGPNGEDIVGEDIIRMLAGIHKDIDNLKFDVIEDAASDDHIFALVHMTGTTNKPVWGMPANHKMDSRSVDVIKVKDGKLSDHWAYFTMAEMMKMMGGAQGGGNPADSSRKN